MEPSCTASVLDRFSSMSGTSSSTSTRRLADAEDMMSIMKYMLSIMREIRMELM